MPWPLTWLGVLLGVWLASIPGALLGALLGHALDRRLRFSSAERVQWLLAKRGLWPAGKLQWQFRLLGALAKADGQVKLEHIQQAREEMASLGLDVLGRELAMHAFAEGKRRGLSVLGGLRRRGRWLSAEQREAWLASAWRMAWADGRIAEGERHLLARAGAALGASGDELRAQAQQTRRQAQQQKARGGADSLAAAFHLLGVSVEAGEAEVKQAYRRLLSRHHPDKQAQQGDAAVQQATEMTRQLREAYQLVCQRRGWR